MTEGKYRDPHEQLLAARRPKHPDLQRLRHVVVEHDDRAMSEGFEGLTGDLADVDSVSYMAEQRVLRLATAADGRTATSRQALQALWMDAFYAGVGFQRAGGHQEVPE